MMLVFAAAFAVFALVMLAMSVGVIFTGRFIRESCGAHPEEGDAAGEHGCVCGASSGGTCQRQGNEVLIPTIALSTNPARPLHQTPVRGATSAAGA